MFSNVLGYLEIREAICTLLEISQPYYYDETLVPNALLYLSGSSLE